MPALSTAGTVAPRAAVGLTLAEPPRPGSDRLRFRLESDAAPVGTRALVTVAALGSGWRHRAAAPVDGAGILALPVRLPGPGLYAALAEVAGRESRAVTFELGP